LWSIQLRNMNPGFHLKETKLQTVNRALALALVAE
jgi:hypothetical protein